MHTADGRSWKIVRSDYDFSRLIEDHINRSINEIWHLLHVIQRCFEEPDLIQATDRGDEENDSRMDFDTAIAASKLYGVVCDENPVVAFDDLEKAPVFFGLKPEMIDVHRDVAALMRSGHEPRRQVLVDEKAGRCHP